MIVVAYRYSGTTDDGEFKEGTASMTMKRHEPSSADELEQLENDVADEVAVRGNFKTLQTTVLNFK